MRSWLEGRRMRDRQTCIGCGKRSPETETNYTLISAQFGWRLTRYRAPDGSIIIEWRCPTCWRDYKKSSRGEASPSSGSERSAAPDSNTAPRSMPSPMPPAPSRTDTQRSIAVNPNTAGQGDEPERVPKRR
jgi:hypothetical protein